VCSFRGCIIKRRLVRTPDTLHMSLWIWRTHYTQAHTRGVSPRGSLSGGLTSTLRLFLDRKWRDKNARAKAPTAAPNMHGKQIHTNLWAWRTRVFLRLTWSPQGRSRAGCTKPARRGCSPLEHRFARQGKHGLEQGLQNPARPRTSDGGSAECVVLGLWVGCGEWCK
jgi:hypothetical protein